MAITAKATWTQSSDGLTVTLKDDSNYSVSGNPAVGNYARAWVVKDAVGTTLFNIPVPSGQLTVNFANAIDKFYNATLSFVGTPSVAPVTIEFGTSQIEANIIDAKLINNCNDSCSNKSDESLIRGFIYMNRAERSVLYTGNGTRFNNFITASKKWLQS